MDDEDVSEQIRLQEMREAELVMHNRKKKMRMVEIVRQNEEKFGTDEVYACTFCVNRSKDADEGEFHVRRCKERIAYYQEELGADAVRNKDNLT